MEIKQEEIWVGTIEQIVQKVKNMNVIEHICIDEGFSLKNLRNQLEDIVEYKGRTGIIQFTISNCKSNGVFVTIHTKVESRVVKIIEEQKSKLVDAYQMITQKKKKGEFNVITCLRQTGVTTTIVSDFINGRFDYMFVRNHKEVNRLIDYYKHYNIKDLKDKIFSIQSNILRSDLSEFRGKKLVFDNCTPFYDGKDKLIGFKKCINTLFQAFGDPVFDEQVTIKSTREISELIENSADTRMYFTM